MRPIDQTTFGFPGGNCFSACVASLLELDIEQVPYFMEPEDAWQENLVRWLAPRGMYPILLRVSDEWYPQGYHILSGQSPRRPEDRDALHSVVALGREIVHDPHPSRAGILDHRDTVVLVPREPHHVLVHREMSKT